jgi:hypothetical protein
MNAPESTGLPVETVQLSAADDERIEPSAWAARAAQLLEVLTDDDVPESEMNDVVGTFRFLDDASVVWSYDGTQWWSWDGQQWQTGEPDGDLRLEPFTMDVPFASFDEPPLDIADATDRYEPTHVVPDGGLWAWDTPDATAAPAAQIEAGVDVMVIDWREDGWAHVLCSNDWSAWLDGRRLTPR